MREYRRNPLVKLKNRIITGLAALTLLYFGSCSVKSSRVSDELEPIREEFRQTAMYSQRGENKSGFDFETGDRIHTMNYGGSIDAVLRKRDAVLDENGCMLIASWWVTQSHKDGRPIPHTKARVLCYNPF